MELNNWYEESFGEDYLSIYDYRDEKEADQDVKGIIKLTRAKEEWNILDLCCGTGRHLMALHRKGYRRLWGLDLSTHLLKRGKKYSNGKGIVFIKGDMRHLPFPGYFDLILSLFTSFGYFFSEEENLRVLLEVSNCLRPGGKFLLDYVNRPYLEKNLVPENIVYKSGKKVQSRRSFSSDGLRIEKEIIITDGENKKIYHESVRLFPLDELVEMLKSAGFINIKYYCGLSKGILTDESPRLAITCENPL